MEGKGLRLEEDWDLLPRPLTAAGAGAAAAAAPLCPGPEGGSKWGAAAPSLSGLNKEDTSTGPSPMLPRENTAPLASEGGTSRENEATEDATRGRRGAPMLGGEGGREEEEGEDPVTTG